jgi:hypothetical protein
MTFNDVFHSYHFPIECQFVTYLSSFGLLCCSFVPSLMNLQVIHKDTCDISKVVPVLNTLWKRMENRGIAPHVLNLGTRWRCTVSFTLRLFYIQVKFPRYTLDRRLGGLQSRSGRGNENNSWPHRSWNPGRPAHSHSDRAIPASVKDAYPEEKVFGLCKSSGRWRDRGACSITLCSRIRYPCSKFLGENASYNC